MLHISEINQNKRTKTYNLDIIPIVVIPSATALLNHKKVHYDELFSVKELNPNLHVPCHEQGQWILNTTRTNQASVTSMARTCF